MQKTFRVLLPALIMLIMVVLNTLPLRIPGFEDFMPMLNVICVYYWAIYQPRLIPYWFLFLLGIVQDAMLGQLLGASSLLFMLLKLFLMTQRRFLSREAFIAVWIGFVIFSLMAAIGYWLVASYRQEAFILQAQPIIQWGMTVATYPLLHSLFNYLFARLSGDRHAS